jgi:rRNA-processing protein FCF1
MKRGSRGRQVLVIDTNILLLLIGYQCLLLTGANGPERLRVLSKIRARDDTMRAENFDHLWKLFGSADRRIVTQHVIAESYGLRRRLKDAGNQKDTIWRAALQLLRDPGMEELSCCINEVQEREGYGSVLQALGPADAGLMYTAERESAVIVTEDRHLLAVAGNRSVRAISLWEIGTL